MIRTLLTTTAVALALSTTAIAQTTTETAPATDAAPVTEVAPAGDMAPAKDGKDNMSTTLDVVEGDAPWDMSAGYMAGEGDALVSQVMGATIFSNETAEAEQIGSVNDLVISSDGEIHAVVIGVGGFLGIGEKNVAVDFASLEHVVAFDGTERWVLATTADALNAAPDFVWEENLDGDPAVNPGNPADPMMAPAEPVDAPAEDAMAPAADGMAVEDHNAMPRDGYATIERDALTAENLTGATVVGPEGDDIAVVGDILLTEDGQVDAMLIDFGGFLGMGEKRVAVTLDNLEFASNESGDLLIYSDFTREQLEAHPAYDEASYATDPAQRATDL